jgi:hypothetical protein
MKLHALIGALNAAERQKIRKYLADSEAKQSERLFVWIAARKNADAEFRDDAERAAVFQQLFKEPYRKDKDYLLRNEYRLLLQRIREAVPNLFFRKEAEQLPLEAGFFVQWLKAHQLTELADEELQEEMKRYQKKGDTERYLRAFDQWNDLRTHHLQQTRNSAEKLIEQSKERILQIKLRMLEEIRREEIRIKHAERVIRSYDARYEPLPMEQRVDLEALMPLSERAQYYDFRARANILMGHEKIATLEQLVSMRDAIHTFEARPDEALCRMYLNLALEYYLEADYAGSLRYFEQAYVRIDAIFGPVREVVIFNYAYSLLKANRYAEALDLVIRHEVELLQSGIIGYKVNLLFVMLHLMADRASEARRFLVFDDKQEIPEFHFSIRLALAAIEYQEGDVAEAHRETQNTEQAINYFLRKKENAQVMLVKHCCTSFLRFFRMELDTPLSERTAQRHLFLASLAPELSNDGKASTYSSILNIWLGREAAK